MQETQAIIHRDLNFLPLKSYANIKKANALLVNWHEFAPQVDYIIGNPPFVGKIYQQGAQKSDLTVIDKRLKPLDYVAGWYFKAAEYMRGNSTRTAFLSTNSITQGEQVGQLWTLLDVNIDFAYKTFTWDSESTDIAAVHCVVIGMSHAPNPKPRKIFLDKINFVIAQNINGYLLDAPNIYVFKRAKPLFEGVPIMIMGSMMAEDGNFKFTPEELEEFINGKLRYCLWLVNATPAEIRKMKLVYERINAVRNYRLSSKRAATRRLADIPHLFAEIRQPTTDYLLIPKVSSEKRRYVPIGFMSPDNIALNTVLMIPNATLYDFGVLTSSIHMGWMRAVSGRMKSDYQYSATIVYNNFVWSAASLEQKKRIEATAQAILDIRAKYPDCTLADLYDELTMPADLRRAHRQNDLEVAKVYGMAEIIDDEREIVLEMFRRYAALTKN